MKPSSIIDVYMQAANSHVGQVKEFHSPAAPSAPQVPSSADLAKELDAYEKAVRTTTVYVAIIQC